MRTALAAILALPLLAGAAQDVVRAAPMSAGAASPPTTTAAASELRDAWMEALRDVRDGENEGEIARGGALFEPDAALPKCAAARRL